MVMASLVLKDCTMNGPAPTGARLNAQSFGGFVASHFFSAVGDGTMPGSVASANWKPAHGSVRVTVTVSLSVATTLLSNGMYALDTVPFRGHATTVSHAGAPAEPDRWRFNPNTTASAS